MIKHGKNDNIFKIYNYLGTYLLKIFQEKFKKRL